MKTFKKHKTHNSLIKSIRLISAVDNMYDRKQGFKLITTKNFMGRLLCIYSVRYIVSIKFVLKLWCLLQTPVYCWFYILLYSKEMQRGSLISFP